MTKKINQEEAVVGVIVVSNTTSIWIIDCNEDYVQFSWNGGRLCRSMTRYDEEGEPYFKSGKTRWYLNQALRINR